MKQSRRLIVQLMEAQLESLFARLNSENSVMSEKSASYIAAVAPPEISGIWGLQC